MLQQNMNSAEIMTLEKMGSRYPSRLSFSRSMLRRLLFDNWTISKSKFDLDENGYGTAIYEIKINNNIYSLVCFSQHLDSADRSDRVIAEKWDTAYSLINGKLDDQELNRLRKNVPLQESGRNSPKELILSRANKSVRLFEYVVNCLSNGKQPDINEINKVGYLLRTTAVYGSGKFGLSDFANTKAVTEFNQPFRAEMLAVYIIREFSVELVEHVAKKQNPSKAIALENNIKQHLGIGNSTGLGMAPFIIKHPKLINKWMKQYSESLKNIVNKNLDPKKLTSYSQLLEKALLYLEEVTTFDEYQITKNVKGFHIQGYGISTVVKIRSKIAHELSSYMIEKVVTKDTKVIKCPMPGLVVSVDIDEGQSVEDGDKLCVVEAMKMENIIRSEASGTIKKIHCREGDSLATDEVMIEFE